MFHTFAPGKQIHTSYGFEPGCRTCGKPSNALAHTTGHHVWTAIIVVAITLLCIFGLVSLIH